MNRGDIYLCDFGTPMGHEPGYRRPALVVSPAELNRHGIVVTLPITRTRRGYPTHIQLEGFLPVAGYVQCELIRTLSTERLIRPLASVGAVELARVTLVFGRLLGIAPARR